MMQTTKYLPKGLKDRKIWVLWKLEERNGKRTKVPYSALYKGRASSTDSTTWGTYSEAESKLSSGLFNGLGVVISDGSGLVFVDVDHCVNDGKFDERGKDVLYRRQSLIFLRTRDKED